MPIFSVGSVLLIVFLLAHLIIWRVRLPNCQIMTLLIIIVSIFAGWVLGALFCSFGIFRIVHAGMFYVSFSLSYLITYAAIGADSPTISLIRFLGKAQSGGRSIAEVDQFMAQRPFVKARLAALILPGLIREEDSRFIATGSQPLSFRAILGFRKLYGPISRGG